MGDLVHRVCTKAFIFSFFPSLLFASPGSDVQVFSGVTRRDFFKQSAYHMIQVAAVTVKAVSS